MNTILLPDGTAIPKVGQGTWYLGEDPHKRASELEALQWGIENGLTLIDTAEMYGEGASEELVGEAIRPFQRDHLFLVSKVYPWNAGKSQILIPVRTVWTALEPITWIYIFFTGEAVFRSGKQFPAWSS